MFRPFSFLFIFTLLLACASQHDLNKNSWRTDTRPKNIILLIGDGMGIGQITAGTFALNNQSQLERFPVTGLHKPYASDSLITDSAAAATAIASGQKTYYGAIGVSPDSTEILTILEEAEARGLKSGLVATSTIVHATPAAFFAHATSRRDYEDIAADFLKLEVDYAVGGGKKYFDRRDSDDRDLVAELEAKNYTVRDYLVDFEKHHDALRTAEKFIWFAADKQPLSVDQGRRYFRRAAMDGVSFLDQQNKSGFFMMIESSQIDWAGHSNKIDWLIEEYKEFDQVIGDVLDWAEKDGETLVILTADHETGGLTIQPGSKMDSLVTVFTTPLHSGDFIPVFAYGPGAHLFSGVYENTAIYHKMRKAMGWDQ